MNFSGSQILPTTLMLLLFYPQKSHRHPALRDSAVASVVYDVSAVLEGKDSESFWNRQEIRREFVVISHDGIIIVYFPA